MLTEIQRCVCVQGPQRQVMEQYQCGGSSSPGRSDRYFSEAPESGRTSGGGDNRCRAAGVTNALPASQLPPPSNLENCMPSIEPFFGEI